MEFLTPEEDLRNYLKWRKEADGLNLFRTVVADGKESSKHLSHLNNLSQKRAGSGPSGAWALPNACGDPDDFNVDGVTAHIRHLYFHKARAFIGSCTWTFPGLHRVQGWR